MKKAGIFLLIIALLAVSNLAFATPGAAVGGVSALALASTPTPTPTPTPPSYSPTPTPGSTPAIFKLSVHVIMYGSYTVSPAGLEGSSGDTKYYYAGTQVQITAVDNNPFKFTNWSGDLTGYTNPATIIMDSDKYVSVNFYEATPTPTNTPTPITTPTPDPSSVPQKNLTVTFNGAAGAASLTPGGTIYGSTTLSYPQGTAVTLTAIPLPDMVSYFDRWGGDIISTQNPITIVMDSDKQVTAYFGKHTPVPTPTPTPSTTTTPTPTPTPTPAPGGMKVQFFNSNTSATTNTIYPNFKLVNTGTTSINLANVKMRYYFTNDGTQANSFACDYSTVGAGNVTGSFTAIAKTNADRYLEAGFTSGAGTLSPGASVELKGRIWKTDWSNFTQTNDYSFNASATNYADWTKVTGYQSGVLCWGPEP